MKTINADAFRNTLSDDRRVTLYDGAVLGADGVLVKLSTVYGLLNEAPAVDVVPVVHGRVVWKNRFVGGFVPDVTITDKAGEKHTGVLDTTHYEPVPYCSECGKELGVSSLAYCPNCGAKIISEMELRRRALDVQTH